MVAYAAHGRELWVTFWYSVLHTPFVRGRGRWDVLRASLGFNPACYFVCSSFGEFRWRRRNCLGEGDAVIVGRSGLRNWVLEMLGVIFFPWSTCRIELWRMKSLLEEYVLLYIGYPINVCQGVNVSSVAVCHFHSFVRLLGVLILRCVGIRSTKQFRERSGESEYAGIIRVRNVRLIIEQANILSAGSVERISNRDGKRCAALEIKIPTVQRAMSKISFMNITVEQWNIGGRISQLSIHLWNKTSNSSIVSNRRYPTMFYGGKLFRYYFPGLDTSKIM